MFKKSSSSKSTAADAESLAGASQHSQLGASRSGTSQRSSLHPVQPGTSQSGASQPGTPQPVASQPGTPQSPQSRTSQPDDLQPAHRATSQPAQQATSKSRTSQSGTSQPGDLRPAQPCTSQPTQRATSQPVQPAQPGTSQSGTSQPGGLRPAQPHTSQSGTSPPRGSQPAQPSTSQPAQQATSQPAQAETSQPCASQPAEQAACDDDDNSEIEGVAEMTAGDDCLPLEITGYQIYQRDTSRASTEEEAKNIPLYITRKNVKRLMNTPVYFFTKDIGLAFCYQKLDLQYVQSNGYLSTARFGQMMILCHDGLDGRWFSLGPKYSIERFDLQTRQIMSKQAGQASRKTHEERLFPDKHRERLVDDPYQVWSNSERPLPFSHGIALKVEEGTHRALPLPGAKPDTSILYLIPGRREVIEICDGDISRMLGQSLIFSETLHYGLTFLWSTLEDLGSLAEKGRQFAVKFVKDIETNHRRIGLTIETVMDEDKTMLKLKYLRATKLMPLSEAIKKDLRQIESDAAHIAHRRRSTITPNPSTNGSSTKIANALLDSPPPQRKSRNETKGVKFPESNQPGLEARPSFLKSLTRSLPRSQPKLKTGLVEKKLADQSKDIYDLIQNQVNIQDQHLAEANDKHQERLQLEKELRTATDQPHREELRSRIQNLKHRRKEMLQLVEKYLDIQLTELQMLCKSQRYDILAIIRRHIERINPQDKKIRQIDELSACKEIDPKLSQDDADYLWRIARHQQDDVEKTATRMRNVGHTELGIENQLATHRKKFYKEVENVRRNQKGADDIELKLLRG